MALSARRDQEKLERAEAILDAAETVFFRKGFARSSMDEIARGAGLSRALLYVYFKDKAAIMRGVMLRAGQALQRRFETALREGGTGLEQIAGIGRSYYAFSLEESDYFDVLTSLNTFPPPAEESSAMAELGLCRQRITGLMVEALNNGLADGSLDRERVSDPLRTACYLQGALHGVIMQTRGPRRSEASYADSDALVNYTLAMLSASMRAR